MTSERRIGEGKGANPVDKQGKNILGRGKKACKGPEAEVSLGYWSKIRRSEGWDRGRR